MCFEYEDFIKVIAELKLDSWSLLNRLTNYIFFHLLYCVPNGFSNIERMNVGRY